MKEEIEITFTKQIVYKSQTCLCSYCGSMVGDTQTHAEWHEKKEKVSVTYRVE